ncbi:MAG: hypothetical protein ACXITV_11125 [Luteibaculaceae bacterium]
MIKLTTTLTLFVFAVINAYSQTVTPCNVYPSNLEENMYFTNYDDSKAEISGLHFLVLSDGNNSQHVTPGFEVSIYLLPVGSTAREDVIIAHTYNLKGIYHFGKHEYKNETISLAGKDIRPGNYRVGIWVNSNQAFEENTSDNTTLFRTPIAIKENPSRLMTKPATVQQKKKDSFWDDDKDEFEEEEEEEEDDDNW